MNRKTNILTALVLSAAALAASATGCELIASIDRNLIDNTGGAGGSGGSGGSGATGGTGGTGGAPCDPAKCPTPSPCHVSVCENDACAEANVAEGTLCVDPAKPDGKTCNASGQCVECTPGGVNNDCPMPPNECVVATCMADVCGTMNVADNTPVATGQTDGDCKTIVCDGAGATKVINDDDPDDDDNDCTADTCDAGTNMHTDVPAGDVCDDNGGNVCGSGGKVGTCVECLIDADCSGVVGKPTCDTNNENFVCVSIGCNNNVKDGNETGLDCGGIDCGNCANGQGCADATDCVSNFCNSANPKVCAACSADGDCAAAEYCKAGVCAPDEADGVACTADAHCANGNCKDSVCCDTSCGSLCEACSAAKKGQGLDGTCGPIAGGIDPDNECTQDAASTCDQNGFCNGAGACQLYANATQCANATCVGNSAQAVSQCNGTGTCVAPGAVDCTPYACAAGVCPSTCAGDAQCASGFFCSGNACVAKKADGQLCPTGTHECTSNFCVDGVCCNSVCTALCQACTAAIKGQGVDGQCGPILAGTDPGNECTQTAASTCGDNGFCDGAVVSACQKYSAATQCAAAVCVGNVANAATNCNGTGTCLAPSTTDCTPYVCAGGACPNTCASDAGCTSGFFCSGTTCTAKKALGAACPTGNHECTNGQCVDGFCCGSATCPKCQACTGAAGTCAAITPALTDDNTAPNTCNGTETCDGAGNCKLDVGETCAANGECASGTCCLVAGTPAACTAGLLNTCL